MPDRCEILWNLTRLWKSIDEGTPIEALKIFKQMGGP